MGKVPEEELRRNFEFYKRWRIDGENLLELIQEYGISYSRAYQLKTKVERKPQYQELLSEFDIDCSG